MFQNFPLMVALFSGGGSNPSVFPASLLISDEPNAFAIDFLSNTYAMNISTGAESLIYNDQVGFALDFTDNTYASRIVSNMVFPMNPADALLFTGPYAPEAGLGVDFLDNSYAVRR